MNTISLVGNMVDAVNTAIKSFSFVRIFSILVIIIALLSNVILNMYNHEPFSKSVLEVGESFFLSTLKLSQESKKIIDNQGIIDLKTTFTYNSLNVLRIYSSLFTSIILIFFWIKIFAWLVSRSFISDTGSSFRNYFMAIIIFYMFQIVFILSYAGLNNNIQGLTGENSVSYYLSVPILCFKDLLFAMRYIIKPIAEYSSKLNSTIIK
jgi:hypothetical protein